MATARTRAGASSRFKGISGFQAVSLLVAVIVVGTLAVTIVRLAVWTWQKYGLGIGHFYATQVFGDPIMVKTIIDTLVIVGVSCALATVIAGVLAFLNERTDASIGVVGRVLPLVPFLMPAISFPLGWVFLTAPTSGLINVLLRQLLSDVGIKLAQGPINIYSWYGMIFLYTVFLSGFAYLVLSSSMRTLDRGLEEAARMAGAGPVKILFRITLPALRPAMITAYFLCAIVGLIMVAVPVTVSTHANIPVLSVTLVNLVTTTTPPAYADAFLVGLLLLVPIIGLWLMQRNSAANGRIAVIGGKASGEARLALGRGGRLLGRLIFVLYVAVTVAFPLLGLLYVSGVSFWSLLLPTTWNPLPNVKLVFSNPVASQAIVWSLLLGVGGGLIMIAVAHVLSYSQRLFPRAGRVVDALVKSPVVIAQILIAVAILVTFGGAPFHLEGTTWIILIGYLLVFLPFSSVLTTGAHQEIGSDVIEAATMAGSSDARTFRSIVTPLTRPALVAGFLLMFVLVAGENNISLILASTTRPVVGYVMVDLFNFGSFPQVASMALVVTLVNLVFVSLFMLIFGSRLPFAQRWPVRALRRRDTPNGAARRLSPKQKATTVAR